MCSGCWKVLLAGIKWCWVSFLAVVVFPIKVAIQFLNLFLTLAKRLLGVKPHCKNCLCNEPELLLMLKEKRKIDAQEGNEQEEEMSCCTSEVVSHWTLPATTLNSLDDALSTSSDDGVADEVELKELRLNFNVGLSLEPEVLKDPQFLDKRLAYIKQGYENERNKLEDERGELLLNKQMLFTDSLQNTNDSIKS